jgi:PAS domain S-box-containing protein
MGVVMLIAPYCDGDETINTGTPSIIASLLAGRKPDAPGPGKAGVLPSPGNHAILAFKNPHDSGGSESVPDRSRSAELAALTAIAAQVNRTQNLHEILRGALKTTLEVIGESSGEIFLIDEEGGDLMLYVHQGLSAAFVADEAVVGANECLCGLAVGLRRPLRIENMADHPARSRSACVREGFGSCIRLPIAARGEVLGLLNVQSSRSRRFTAEDEDLLVAIGHQIGIAIANARSIQDAERRRATLNSVMDSMVDGLILIDKQGKIAYVNRCAEEMLSLTSRMLIGRSEDALNRELAQRGIESTELLVHLQDAASEAEEPPMVELSTPGPRPRALQAHFFPICGDGQEALGIGLLLHDITREKELDQMKSQLLATVSHELRTPLASIKGFATTLLRDDVVWDEESRREFLSIIDQESDRLSELIGNLLDMSRIEAGTLRMEPEPTDLRSIVQETIAEFQVITREHDFEAHLPPSVPRVWADPRRVRQVLRNLVENAVKYSPQKGSVVITLETDGDSVQLSVSDQGLGIEHQHLAHVFERFYQVDTASTRSVGGTGLGLSICKAIVEAHHGRIWAESQVGVGSTFHFTLPLTLPLEADLAEDG